MHMVNHTATTISTTMLFVEAFIKVFLASLYNSSIAVTKFLQTLTRDRKSTRLNSSHMSESRMPSSAWKKKKKKKRHKPTSMKNKNIKIQSL